MRRSYYRQSQAGYALLLVLLFAAGTLMVLCGVLGWSTGKVTSSGRQTKLHNAIGAAEAATEKVITQMTKDFQKSGGAILDANLPTYRSLVPTLTESSLLSNFTFQDTNGTPNQLTITKLLNWQYTNLESTSMGLQGYAVKYSVQSWANDITGSSTISSGVEQDVEFASLPIFQYQVFYAMDMEIAPGSSFTLSGRVHSNGNIYLNPNQCTLTFNGAVTAGQQILLQKSPSDPTSRIQGTVAFQTNRLNRVKTLNSPIGTNVGPTALRQLVEIPPVSESATSQLGQQRYYNKADMIILVYSDHVVTQSGSYNNFTVSIPWSTTVNFLNTNVVFFDKREGQYILASEFNVQAFTNSYSSLTASLGRPPKTIYLANLWTNVSAEATIRLANGQYLPTQGLTIATPNPLYIKGHYNAPAAQLGTTNTIGTAPASVVADAITILSSSWIDGYSIYPLTYRTATSTTVNAALLGGIVPSGWGYYSGGVENMVRLLENWSGKTLTLNGSLVVLYQSQIATGPWGATSQVYNTPTRNYNFDQNFLNLNKLPPSWLELRTVIRTKWVSLTSTTS